ncbi:MAG: P-loop NTPase fold protein [Anaerolineae bacterium]
MSDVLLPLGSGILPDLPAAEDKLGFTPYANTLRDIILDDNTRTPLTIGIFGSWGSGKTSLMKLIEQGLKEKAAEEESGKKTHTVWFNAWLYSKEQALWRALVMQVLAAIRKVRGGDAAVREELNSLAEKFYRAAGPPELGSLTIKAADLLNEPGNASITLALQQGIDLLASISDGLQEDGADAQVTVAKALRDQVRRTTAAMKLDRIESLEQFREQFQNLIEAHVAQFGTLVVFVDDLDRCLPEKAVEVLEAIKLFMDVEGCIFVLGIDQDVIQRGIRLRYGELGGAAVYDGAPLLLDAELLEQGPSRYRAFMQELTRGEEDVIDGGRYLEKIIQIPFTLPPISQEALGYYIGQLGADLPHPDCAWVFARGLEPNPRQVKRAINIFTLLWTLSRKTEMGTAITPIRLAKVVVIQQRYPELYDLLREDPSRLIRWEAYFRSQRGEKGPWLDGLKEVDNELELEPKAANYDQRPSLERLLLMHDLPEEPDAGIDGSFVLLTDQEVVNYVYLTRTVKESVPPPATGPVEPAKDHETPELPEGVITLASRLDENLVGYLKGRMTRVLEGLPVGSLTGEDSLRRIETLVRFGAELLEKTEFQQRQLLEEALNAPKQIHLTNSLEAQLPWEIAYDLRVTFDMADVPSAVQAAVDGFWGFKHVIERPFLLFTSHVKSEVGKPVAMLLMERKPTVALSLSPYPDLESDRVRDLFTMMGDSINVVVIDDPDQLLKELVSQPIDAVVIHQRAGLASGEIWIEMGKGRRFTRRSLFSIGGRSVAPTMMYFNVTSGVTQYEEWTSWLKSFNDMGIGGVIAPAVAANPEWSPALLKAFMERFLAGQEVGLALRDARRALLQDQVNPLGLLFTHVGRADLRLLLPDEEPAP